MGLTIPRRYTKAGTSPYADIPFRKATSEIRNPDGSIVFRLADIDVPAQFSQVVKGWAQDEYGAAPTSTWAKIHHEVMNAPS